MRNYWPETTSCTVACTSFWSALIAPLIYLALFAFCSRDIRILDLAQVVGRRYSAVFGFENEADLDKAADRIRAAVTSRARR